MQPMIEVFLLLHFLPTNPCPLPLLSSQKIEQISWSFVSKTYKRVPTLVKEVEVQKSSDTRRGGRGAPFLLSVISPPPHLLQLKHVFMGHTGPPEAEVASEDFKQISRNFCLENTDKQPLVSLPGKQMSSIAVLAG